MSASDESVNLSVEPPSAANSGASGLGLPDPPMLGYARVSTDDQAYGVGAQEQRIIEARGPLRILVDDGYSAKTLDRPALQEALQLIAAKEASGLVVAKLDRLTRSIVDFASLLEWFERADASLVVLDMQVDTSSPGGRMIAHVFAVFAQWEREMIAQRTREGLAEARRRGARFRPAIADDPELLQTIRDLRDCGESLRAICCELERMEVPTVRGGARWSPSALQSVLGYQRPKRARSVVLPKL